MSITPVKRRLDYKAALGIVKESPGGRKVIQIRSHRVEEESIDTESQRSEYSEEYTLEEDEYSEESSQYDESEDDSYEKAMTVFSRKV